MTKCWKPVNACVHTVCMNPKAGNSGPMCVSVKLCTLITCPQSFYFTESPSNRDNKIHIPLGKSQLYTHEEHVVVSSHC